MSTVGRVISKVNWEKEKRPSGSEIPAKAMLDLRASRNTLSFWRCETNESLSLDNVALAVAAGRENIAPIDVVCLSEKDLKNNGIELLDSYGECHIDSFNKHHCEARELSCNDLISIAEIIDRSMNRHRGYTERQVYNIIANALKEKILDIEKLNKPMKESIIKWINRDSKNRDSFPENIQKYLHLSRA